MNKREQVNAIIREEKANIEASKLLRDGQLTKLRIWADALRANRKAAKRGQKEFWRWQLYYVGQLKSQIVQTYLNRETLIILWAARAIREIAPTMLTKRHQTELKEWDRGSLLEPPADENIALHRECWIQVNSRGAQSEQRFYSQKEVAFRRRCAALTS